MAIRKKAIETNIRGCYFLRNTVTNKKSAMNARRIRAKKRTTSENVSRHNHYRNLKGKTT